MIIPIIPNTLPAVALPVDIILSCLFANTNASIDKGKPKYGAKKHNKPRIPTTNEATPQLLLSFV